jgi:hypothetical protein
LERSKFRRRKYHGFLINIDKEREKAKKEK